ncbi:DUF5042 domain-containing protein [Bacteroides fragilis]|nr:DUF5042 domain-containing protein [Bacteroides fragilis]
MPQTRQERICPIIPPGGILQNAVPWDFLGEGMEEVDREDIVGAAFPAIIRGAG